MQNLSNKYNILIVEDNIEVANLIYKILEKNKPYCIQIAHRINQAKKHVEKTFFDLICLDILLPDGNGIDFCRDLKTDFPNKTIKILIISNNKTMDSETQAFESGADDYIFKPFHPKEIEIRIKHHLGIIKKPLAQTKFKQFSLDPIHNALIYNEYQLPLTKTEFLVLQYLFGHNGVGSADILSKFLSSKKFKNVDRKSVIVTIKRLREKLKRNTGNPFIKTKYGIGYYIP